MAILTYWIMGLMDHGLSLDQLLTSLMVMFWLLGVLPIIIVILLLARLYK